MSQPPASSPQPSPPPAAAGAPPVQRQFVNFAFYRLDPAVRHLPDQEKWRLRSEFLKLVRQAMILKGP